MVSSTCTASHRSLAAAIPSYTLVPGDHTGCRRSTLTTAAGSGHDESTGEPEETPVGGRGDAAVTPDEFVEVKADDAAAAAE